MPESAAMLAAYVSGHGFGHLTRLCEVLRVARARAPSLPMTLTGAVEPAQAALAARALGPGVVLRPVACDAGLAQRDALVIDEPGTAARCAELERSWAARLEAEVAFLRERGARLVLGDVPPLAFAAAARAGVPALALGNFGWDAVYRHLAARQPSLAASADRAAAAYATVALLLELPFATGLESFRRREPVGLVARRPAVPRGEARRRLGLDGRPAVLLSFGGVGLPGLERGRLAGLGDIRLLWPDELAAARLDALGLDYPDVVGAVDAVVTKPGYGIVSDAVAAGTPLVYTERGDFPEYEVLVRDMVRLVPCAHVSNADLLAGRLEAPLRQVLDRPRPAPPDLGGAGRAAGLVLEALAG
jgi:L-arabinokinase